MPAHLWRQIRGESRNGAAILSQVYASAAPKCVLTLTLLKMMMTHLKTFLPIRLELGFSVMVMMAQEYSRGRSKSMTMVK